MIEKKDPIKRRGYSRSVYIEYDLSDQIDDLADETNRSASEIINIILKEFFRRGNNERQQN